MLQIRRGARKFDRITMETPMRRLLAAVTVLSAYGCAQPAPPGENGPPALLEGEWRVVDVDRAAVIDDAEVTVNFAAGGKLSGRSACNRYGGEFTYAAGVLTVGALYSTKMACAAPLMDLEARFLNRLEGTLEVKAVEGDVLSFEDDEGRILIRKAR